MKTMIFFINGCLKMRPLISHFFKPNNYSKSILPLNNVIPKLYFSSENRGIVNYDDIKKLAMDSSKKVLIIDVREEQELKETGILPNSINIPLGELEYVLKCMSKEEFLKKFKRQKPDPDSAIIYSCMAGIRSGKAQIISQELGYKNTKSYSGGWQEWEQNMKK